MRTLYCPVVKKRAASAGEPVPLPRGMSSPFSGEERTRYRPFMA